MFNVGDKIRVLEPFKDSFPEVYEIVEVIVHEDGQVACVLENVGAFDPKYLGAAE